MWFVVYVESLQDSLWSFQLPVELIAEAFRSLKKVCGTLVIDEQFHYFVFPLFNFTCNSVVSWNQHRPAH